MAKVLLASLAQQTGWSEKQLEQAVSDARKRLLDAPPEQSKTARAPSVTVPGVTPPPVSRPTRAVSMRLASGRTVHVRLDSLARREELAELRRVHTENADAQRKVLVRHERALRALQRRLGRAETDVLSAGQRADLALLLAMGRGLSFQGLTQRLNAKVTEQDKAIRELKQAMTLARHSALQENTARAVKDAVGAMQVAAYGEKGNVFAGNNLLLGGSQLIWSFLGPLLQRAGVTATAGMISPAVWGPVASLLIGHLTLGQHQFERFVSGELELTSSASGGTQNNTAMLTNVSSGFASTWAGSLDLKDHIAPAYWSEFKARTDVTARAEAIGRSDFSFAVAQVVDGVLHINAVVISKVPSLRVRWTVDTGSTRG